MKQNHDVYLFGQVLGTHSFLLKGGFLQPDEYSEIAEQYFLPGGETGTAATVLSSLGVSIRMDGNWIGTASDDPIWYCPGGMVSGESGCPGIFKMISTIGKPPCPDQ